MMVARLQTRGLKGRDHDLVLGDVTLLLGPNGAGKTEVLQALHLLARGAVPELPATPDGVMRLARGDAIEVTATLDTGQVVTRRWARDAKGKISASGEISGMTGVSPSAATGAITAQLGQWAESWRPDDLLGASAAKMRSRLIDLLGAADVEIPADLGSATDGVEAWLDGAKRRTKRAVDDAHAAVTRLRAVLSSTEHTAVPDAAPIEADLARLRAELADAQVCADLARDIATAEREVAAGGDVSSLTAATNAVERAQYAVAERQRAVEDLDRARQQIGAAQRTLSDYAKRGCSETADLVDVDEFETDLEIARAERADAERAEATARSVLRDANARLAAVTTDPPVRECPSCGCDLADALVEPKRQALADRDTARERFAEAADALAMAMRAVMDAEGRHSRTVLGSQARELLARTWPAVEAAHEAEQRLAGMRSGADLDAAMRAAVSAMHDAEANARTYARAEAAKGRLGELRERLESIPPARPMREVEAEIAGKQRMLVALGESRARAAARADAEAEIAEATEAERVARLRAGRVREIEARMLASVRERLEAPLSEACGAPVSVVLEDARGNATCRITLRGVDVASISTGERLRFVGALLVVLGRLSAAPWKPVLIDGLESISAEHRAPFLAMLRDATRAGAISQALVAGCPDEVPEVEGVDVVRLTREGVIG